MCRAMVISGSSNEVAQAATLASRFFPISETPSSMKNGVSWVIVNIPEPVSTRANELRKAALLAAMKRFPGNVQIHQIPEQLAECEASAVESPGIFSPFHPVEAATEMSPSIESAKPVDATETPFSVIDFYADTPEIEFLQEEPALRRSVR